MTRLYKTERRTDGFWCQPVADGVDEMGTFVKLSDAQDARDGVERSMANVDRRGYWTTDPPVAVKGKRNR